jgi:hypothetical protein
MWWFINHSFFMWLQSVGSWGRKNGIGCVVGCISMLWMYVSVVDVVSVCCGAGLQQIWFHDGISTGASMLYDGQLLPTTDLQHCNLCLVLYSICFQNCFISQICYLLHILIHASPSLYSSVPLWFTLHYIGTHLYLLDGSTMLCDFQIHYLKLVSRFYTTIVYIRVVHSSHFWLIFGFIFGSFSGV